MNDGTLLLGNAGAVDVEVTGATQKAVDTLKGVAGVTDVTVTRMDGETSVLRVVGTGELRPALAKALVAADVPLLKLDKAATRLENIFLKLTESEKPEPKS